MGDEDELDRDRVLELLKGDGIAAPRVAAQAYLLEEPGDTKVQAYLASLYVQVCRWDLAGPMLIDLLDSEDGFARITVRMNLATLAWDRGHIDQAERHLRVQVEQNPGYAVGYVRLGELLALTGRREEAEQCFREGTGGQPSGGGAWAWEALVRLLVRERRYDEALAAVDEALALGQELSGVAALIEDARRAQRIVGTARAESDSIAGRARRAWPRRSSIVRASVPGRFAACGELALKYLARHPDSDQARLNLAKARHELGDHAGAKALLEGWGSSWQKPASGGHAHIFFGHIARATGDYAGAERHYRESLRKRSRGRIFIGALFAVQGRLHEALEVHREAARSPDECVDEAWYNIGLILRAFERYDEAAQAFERAIELDPDYDIAKQALADCREALDLQATLGPAC